MKTILLLFSFCWMFNYSAIAFQTTEPKTGMDVLEIMHSKYEGKWYKNFTFTQETIFYGANSKIERVQTWYEAMNLPGKLAIKFDSKDSGNGILFNNGTQYGYANSQKIQEVQRVHELLVLGFDVYHQSVETTANQLTANGYDLQKMYKDEWQGRSVYVIGVNEADSTKPQFWIDTERLVFVRNFTIGRGDMVQEIQFNNYEKLGNGWVAPEVIFKVNGMLGLVEKYSEMEIPDSLIDDIFNPEKFVDADW